MNKNSPIEFLDYDRISDILIYFSQDISLKFNVHLGKKDKDGHRRFFHRETRYQSKYSNVGPVVSIKRDMNFYFSIDDNRNYLNGVMIGIQDIYLFKMLVDTNILPWFIGNKNIFGTHPDDGSIIIKGKWKPQQFILSDYKYLEFMPIVLLYDDEKSNYGIRMIINNPENFVDMDLNKFLAFYTILTTTDMYAVASSMIDYVKNGPYGINMYNMVDDNGYNKPTKNFFDNL